MGRVVFSLMTYWWASQSKNYRTAIPDGTLWTRPRVNGVMPAERAALQLLAPDDIVFHYGGQHLRAVSVVVAAAVDARRPPGYPRGTRETDANDDGKLVRVDVFASDLALPWRRVAQLIEPGTPGPLTVAGVPREAYISPLNDADADALLAELGVEAPLRHLPGRPHENWAPGSGDTDATAIARIRTEQSQLRAYLLDDRASAECGICNRAMPADLLVAGHIIPRRNLDDAQRRDFESVAMLVCVLGCDALFESGYLVVGKDGRVAAGRATSAESVVEQVAVRTGGRSPAWRKSTAPAFESHAAMHRS
jgi:hypothetical protein